MLHRLRAQLHTWYLRYYFFHDPLRYKAIVTISELLSQRAPEKDRLACRELFHLYTHFTATVVLQPLLDCLLMLIVPLADNDTEYPFTIPYYRFSLLPLEVHHDQLWDFRRAVITQTGACKVRLHTELVSLYKATGNAQLLDLIKVVYQQASEEEFWQFWDEAMDAEQLRAQYQFASEAYTPLAPQGDALARLMAHYPIQKLLVDMLIDGVHEDLFQSASHVTQLYQIAKMVDHAPKDKNTDLYAQLCGRLQSVGVRPPVALVFSESFRVTVAAIARYQSNVKGDLSLCGEMLQPARAGQVTLHCT